ncbi:hypothetical protein FNF29_00928 [Cafeteria roenbergensis]|uniref:Uncharacterized protein n=1 Tax=Cafeteria roenbergensis TaxID=33653 RepID=A0A5A8D1G7_CAFRO|nr:hypothetical protein FNF29_00928 [Cafeteria roenbergensis]KAA0159312.1 hypothetical protein FNF31_04901 [Cafeteria roenbergensis]KAA0167585.1 hypothetical protein FNF28_02799 [Cafeteria roenbergensis]|eukprot:KAA0156818.1 hypothetical protein FNF29_00928 [Cafeteria roenbergensis]
MGLLLSTPVLNSVVAGLMTSVGALVYFCPCTGTGSNAILTFVLAFAAGVMVTVSMTDMLLPSLAGSHTSLMAVTFLACFVLGMIIMVLADALLPSDVSAAVPFFAPAPREPASEADRPSAGAGLAGPGAPAGALDGEATALVDDAGPTMELSAEEGLLQGAEAGLGGGLAAASGGDDESDSGRSSVSSHEGVRSRSGRTASEAGQAAAAPGPSGPQAKAAGTAAQTAAARQSRLAAVMFLALTIHNLPEGVAVAASSLSSAAAGNHMTAAIAVHNAVEGLALATPVLAATGSPLKALAATLVSGLTEPVGAVLTLLVLGLAGAGSAAGPASMSGDSASLKALLCVAAGVMVQVCLQELLPEAWENAVKAAQAGALGGWAKASPTAGAGVAMVASTLVGCLVMAALTLVQG